MKLEEIAKSPMGTYVAVKYDKESCKKIKEICEELGLPNRVPSEKLHTTIIYSRKYAPDVKADNAPYQKGVYADVIGFDVFKTQDNKNALVLKLNCPHLIQRHNTIMEEHQTTYDFPEYIPHVTISYDCGDFDHTKYTGTFPKLRIVEEYVEELVLNWQNKK